MQGALFVITNRISASYFIAYLHKGIIQVNFIEQFKLNCLSLSYGC
jgi:hypothetical protein